MGPLLPIALLIGSYLANQEAQGQVSDARNSRLRDEGLRQKALGAEADARLRETLAAQQRPAMEQDQRVAEASREQKYATAAPTTADTGYVTAPSAPKEVKSELAARMVDAIRRGRQQSQALATLGATSDATANSQIGLARSAQDLNLIGGRSRASSAILPYELSDANRKGQGARTVADLFNVASLGTGLYGMANPPVDYGGFYARSAANPTFSH